MTGCGYQGPFVSLCVRLAGYYRRPAPLQITVSLSLYCSLAVTVSLPLAGCHRLPAPLVSVTVSLHLSLAQPSAPLAHFDRPSLSLAATVSLHFPLAVTVSLHLPLAATPSAPLACCNCLSAPLTHYYRLSLSLARPLCLPLSLSLSLSRSRALFSMVTTGLRCQSTCKQVRIRHRHNVSRPLSLSISTELLRS